MFLHLAIQLDSDIPRKNVDVSLILVMYWSWLTKTLTKFSFYKRNKLCFHISTKFQQLIVFCDFISFGNKQMLQTTSGKAVETKEKINKL